VGIKAGVKRSETQEAAVENIRSPRSGRLCALLCSLRNQCLRLFFALEFVFVFFTVRDLIAGFVGCFVA
jgi:hypothetical protein